MLMEERVYFISQLQRGETTMLGGVAARSRHSDWNSKLTACIVKYTQEAERVNWKG